MFATCINWCLRIALMFWLIRTFSFLQCQYVIFERNISIGHLKAFVYQNNWDRDEVGVKNMVKDFLKVKRHWIKSLKRTPINRQSETQQSIICWKAFYPKSLSRQGMGTTKWISSIFGNWTILLAPTAKDFFGHRIFYTAVNDHLKVLIMAQK
jgi:hypothetical protein